MDPGVQGPAAIWVMDSSAIIAYTQMEAGADRVRLVLRDQANACTIHAINLCEVFYDAVRREHEASARAVIERLLDAGLTVRADMDPEFWEAAGLLKARQHRVSLADCFCVTLARRLGGRILTCDHHEFDRVAPLGLCPVEFAR